MCAISFDGCASNFRRHTSIAPKETNKSPVLETKVVINASKKKALEFTYANDGLLSKKKIGNSDLTYVYNSDKLLAYATSDKGHGYSIARDLKGRITLISGVGSTELRAIYEDNSINPTKIVVSKSDGTISNHNLLVASDSKTSSPTLTKNLVDQKIAGIYELSTVVAMECGGALYDEYGDTDCYDPYLPGDGCYSQGIAPLSVIANNKRTVFAKPMPTAAGSCPNPNWPPEPLPKSNCDILLDQLIAQCQRIYPGAKNGTGDTEGRSLCYQQANEIYSQCLRVGD